MSKIYTPDYADEKIAITDGEEQEGYLTKTKIGKKHGYGLFIFSTVLLINANLNIIDILPDFISYFILSLLIGRIGHMVPYMAECKTALNKLALITLMKIPATLIMVGNMTSGRDIIPLFTLAFCVLELIFIYSALSNGFSGLFYLGQRRDKTEGLIHPFSVFGKQMTPDGLRVTAFVFFSAKALLSFLPELTNLSGTSSSLMPKLRHLYPYFFGVCFAVVTLFGVYLLIITLAYISNVRKSTDLKVGILEFTGDEKLRAIDNQASMRGYLETVTVLLFSSLLSFDIQLDSYGDVLILPHFFYGILLIYIACRITAKKSSRSIAVALASVYTLMGAVSYFLGIRFHDNFDYRDLQINKAAQSAYRMLEISSVIECIFYIGLCIVLASHLIDFIDKHTLLSDKSSPLSVQSAKYRKATRVKSIGLFTVGGVSAMVKLIKIISDAEVEMIITGADVVTASSMPWLGLLSTAASFAFFVFSWYFLSSVKEDIEMKYKDEGYSFR